MSTPRSWKCRLWSRVSIAIALVGASLLWSQTNSFRCAILQCLAFAYGIWDPLTQEAPVKMGPPDAISPVRSTRPTEASQLAEWFPDCRFEVSRSAPPLLPGQSIVFQHESLDSPQMAAFRLEVEPILEGSTDIFSLSAKVRGLARHGVGAVDLGSKSNPLELLRFAQQGQPLTCRPFALVYGSCAVLQGYTSRLIALSADGTKFDHAVTEVYVPEHAKWIVIDPDFNIAYRRHGQWQNAAELHGIWQDIKLACQEEAGSQVAIRRQLQNAQLELAVLGSEGEELRRTNLFGSGDGIGLRFYDNVIYSTRNNYLTGSYPKGHPKRTLQYALTSKNDGSRLAVCPEAITVFDREEIYFPVGRSEIEIVGGSDKTTIEMRLRTWTPNFKEFEVRIDHAEWIARRQPLIMMDVSTGTHVYEVRSVNSAGLRGEISKLKIVSTELNKVAPSLSTGHSSVDTKSFGNSLCTAP